MKTSLFGIAVSLVLCLAVEGYFDPNCIGDRRPVVLLFEWPWKDVALECENVLSKYGYCGVHISPEIEHRVVMEDKFKRPWWERYQPVSFEISSKSGDEAAFVDMVKRCNKVGVRVYADAIFNHMVAEESGVGTGIYGSAYNSHSMDFAGVPFNSSHFHQTGTDCPTASGKIENWQSTTEIRNCRLENLVDLDQGNEEVQAKVVTHLNKLIDLGIAGFRIDSARFMEPWEIKTIINNLHTLNTTFFYPGSKPYIWQEVEDVSGQESKPDEYYGYARVSEYNYGRYVTSAFAGKMHLKDLKQLEAALIPGNAAVISIDTPVTQRDPAAISFHKPRQYKMAIAFMLAWPYGLPHLMSSYRWEQSINKDGKDDNAWMGPPHDKRYRTLEVMTKGDLTCRNDWVCEHRWGPIQEMIQFSNVATTEKVENWWDDGDDQIAFSRGNKAFFALNGGNKHMSGTFQTGMAPGWYCDVMQGGVREDFKDCIGSPVRVDGEGKVNILIRNTDEDPIFAIHKGTQISDDPGPEPEPVSTTPFSAYQRTVIFLQYNTIAGQDLFLRGGISHARRPSCDSNPSACYIPITYSHVSYSTKHYNGYNAWSKNDKYLDWKGTEPGQGTFNNEVAEGSPMVWTTNSPITDVGYHQLNTFGPAYWMLDVMMDCAATENGWFEMKGILDGRWEKDVKQAGRCSGNAGMTTLYSTTNHLAKCGFKNVFIWDQSSCRIDVL